VHDQPLWSLLELQELLDEWLVALWANRPHDGLRDPVTPGRAYTPNEKYAALVESAGYVPVALSPQDYIELLPARWQAINAYGVKINHRIYDDKALNPFRRQRSGVTDRKNLWEVHHDPYDVSRIWVRNHWDGGGWITVFWRHLRSVPAPFGELAWDHARHALAASGQSPTEEQIAAAVADLLTRAAAGPDEQNPAEAGQVRVSKKDRRVAARTKATATPAWPRPKTPLPPAPQDTAPEPDMGDEADLAEVLPLRVFDARKEAERWPF
jgi:hypothetical protein